MGIIKNTLQKQIDNKSFQQYYSDVGTIIDYSPITNTATVTYKDPNGEGIYTRRNVPVADTMGGICGYSFRNGDQCMLEFRNGSVRFPVITGVTKSFYENRKNTNQGACIVDESINDIVIPEDISPMCYDWIDEDNYNIAKYDDESTNYIYSRDEESTFYEIIQSANNYSDKEQGITHIDNHSTVKIKENGDIEMFVDNNIGLRISKKMQKIYIYGLTVEMQ